MSLSIAIVGGCGHVGLPLGIALARAGARVTLIDTSVSRVDSVRQGRMPFLERGSDEQLPEVLRSGRMTATTSQDTISQVDTVIVTIGTPVDEFMDPSVRSFDEAMASVLDRMHDGQLLVLRSTVFPGVTQRLAKIVAGRNLRVEIAYCPERIAQSFALEELGRLPQIIGAVTPNARSRAAALFDLLGVRLIDLTPLEAELAKLFSNAYRYINFAIANQFHNVCQKFDADFSRIHAACTADYPRMSGFARAGFTGGPCLLKDTMQLAAFNHNSFALGQAAMMVNEGLPCALVESIKQRMDLGRATAGILGMAFKGNCDDPRDSLSYKLRKILRLECHRVLCTDPFIKDSDFVSLETVLAESDVLFVGACHDEYRSLTIEKPLVDVFGFIRNSAPVAPHLSISEDRPSPHRKTKVA